MAFGEAITGKAPTPATSKLFVVNESELLNEDKSEKLHHIVAKLLYVSIRKQVDLSTEISFLCTRVSKNTIEDWEKLCRLLQYMKRTINMRRVLGGTEGLECLSIYADASCATHMDTKGHTGGFVSLGRGTIHKKSSKQKINTKSLTESEVVGTSDFIPRTMWLR